MSLFVQKPLIAGLTAFFLLIIVCLLISVPLMNATCFYQENLVQFQAPAKVSLQHLFGIHLEDLTVNKIQPKEIVMTGQGWIMLILFHLGIPLLMFLRFYFAKKKQELSDAE